jgi:hypothetical protein
MIKSGSSGFNQLLSPANASQTQTLGAAERQNLDMSLNSINFNRLINQKKNVETGWQKKTFSDIPSGTEVQPAEFNSRKERSEVARGDHGLTSPGKLVTEKMMQVSRDEQKYFENTGKIFSKEALKESKYKRQIPDYLRLMEDPSKQSYTLSTSIGNQVKLSEIDKTGMVTIVSKN